jgi:hypothetical protein
VGKKHRRSSSTGRKLPQLQRQRSGCSSRSPVPSPGTKANSILHGLTKSRVYRRPNNDLPVVPVSTHLVDVEASDQCTVKLWFADKVDFSPPVRDFADQGFSRSVAALTIVRGDNVAVLVYRFKSHYVSLLICREGTPEAAESQTSFNYQGYNLVYWSANGLDCWAVSDAAPGALLEFAKIQQAEHSCGALFWVAMTCGTFG